MKVWRFAVFCRNSYPKVFVNYFFGQKYYFVLYFKKSHLDFHVSSVHRGEKMSGQKNNKSHPCCKLCDKVFRSHSNLKEHMWRHANLKPYKCDQCPKSFWSKVSFGMHKNTHDETKAYTCRVCERPFHGQQALNIHEMIHTGEKPLSCEKCGATFRYNNALKNHVVRCMDDSGEGEFQCKVCKIRFLYRRNFVQHLKIHE